MKAIFEIRIVYIVKMIQTLIFQMVIPFFDTLSFLDEIDGKIYSLLFLWNLHWVGKFKDDNTYVQFFIFFYSYIKFEKK